MLAKFMAFRFSGNGFENSIGKCRIADIVAQQMTKFILIFLAQAKIQGTIHGETDTIASGTKMLRQGCDKSEAEKAIRRLKIPCRSAAGRCCRAKG